MSRAGPARAGPTLARGDVFEAAGLRFRVRPGTHDPGPIIEVVRRRGYERLAPCGPGQLWLDGGANIGAFSCHAIRAGAAVFAYEPDPDSYGLLVANVADNGGPAAPFVGRRAALVAGPEPTATLYVNARHPGASSLVVRRGRLGSRSPREVPARDFAEALAEAPFTHVKLDVEGSELALCSSVTDWRTVRTLVLEWHSAALRDRGRFVRYAELIAALRPHFPRVVAPRPPGRGFARTWLVAAYR